MKSIITKVGLCILALCVVLGVVVYRFMFHNPDKPDVSEIAPIVTDALGTTYYAIADKDTGETHVVVTDVNGNKYKAEFDGQNVGNTVGQINDEVNSEDIPTNYTGPHIDVTASSGAYQGSAQQAVSTTSPVTEPSTGEAQPSQPVSQAPTYKFDKYSQIFKGGNFLMQIDDKDMGPVTMAMKNGNIYMEASMESISMKILYQSKADKWYLLLDNFKKYSEMPSDMLGDLDPSSITSDLGNSSGGADVSVSEVEIDGKRLICESTRDENGNTVNFYFDGDVLVRQDTVSPDGSVSSTYFTRVTTDVPDTLFEIPSNYSYWNLKWLMEAAVGS